MAEPNFGGHWTELKLDCIEEYLRAWNAVLKNSNFQKRYIDAFSGSGHYIPRTEREQSSPIEKLATGSAIRALSIEPAFDQHDFIELNRSRAKLLEAKAKEVSERRVNVHANDVNFILPNICQSMKKNERAVLFLDPFGAQVHWDTVVEVSKSKKIDMWYLLPVSILNRMISERKHQSTDAWEHRLNLSFGTDQWKSEFFEPSPQGNLFDTDKTKIRKAGVDKVERYLIDRLGQHFPFVLDNCLRLITPRGVHLFSLCFAVSNPSSAAIKPARKIAAHLVKKFSSTS